MLINNYLMKLYTKSMNWVSFAQMSFLNDVSPVKNLIIHNFNLPKEDKFFLRD